MRTIMMGWGANHQGMAQSFLPKTFQYTPNSMKTKVEWRGDLKTSVARISKNNKDLVNGYVLDALASQIPSLPPLAVIINGAAYTMTLQYPSEEGRANVATVTALADSTTSELPTLARIVGVTAKALLCTSASMEQVISLDLKGNREPIVVASVTTAVEEVTMASLKAQLLEPSGAANVAGDAVAVILPGHGIALVHTENYAAYAAHLDMCRDILRPFGLARDSGGKHVPAMALEEGSILMRSVADAMSEEQTRGKKRVGATKEGPAGDYSRVQYGALTMMADALDFLVCWVKENEGKTGAIAMGDVTLERMTTILNESLFGIIHQRLRGLMPSLYRLA